jgi:hypothetical protein
MDEKALFTGFWIKESETRSKAFARIPEGSDYRPEPRSGPAAPLAWSFLFDVVHHRGQLSTHQRPMGSTAPQIYGPSGDEP